MSRLKLRVLQTKFCVQRPLLCVSQQNLASEEAKDNFFFHNWGEGGSGPYMEFSIIDFISFLNHSISQIIEKKQRSASIFIPFFVRIPIQKYVNQFNESPTSRGYHIMLRLLRSMFPALSLYGLRSTLQPSFVFSHPRVSGWPIQYSQLFSTLDSATIVQWPLPLFFPCMLNYYLKFVQIKNSLT